MPAITYFHAKGWYVVGYSGVERTLRISLKGIVMNESDSAFMNFIQPTEWTTTAEGSRRTPMNGITVDILYHGKNLYQPIIDRHGVSGKNCTCILQTCETFEQCGAPLALDQ